MCGRVDILAEFQVARSVEAAAYNFTVNLSGRSWLQGVKVFHSLSSVPYAKGEQCLIRTMLLFSSERVRIFSSGQNHLLLC